MLIQTRKQFEAARTALIQAPIIAVDTETTGLHFHMGDKIIGVSTYCPMPGNEKYGLSFYFPFRHSPKSLNLFTNSDNLPIEWLDELGRVLSDPTKEFIFHNAKFDLKMLRQEGIHMTGKIYDTMVMSHMVDENGVHSLKGLGALKWGEHVRIEEKATKKLIQKLGGWDKVTAAEMAPYACKDAELTYDLWLEFMDELVVQELMPLWPREEAFLHVLKELEWQGIEVDADMAESYSGVARLRMRELEDELGFDPLKLDVLAHKLFASPPEGLGLLPQSLTDTSTQEFPRGRPVMDEQVLSGYQHPLVELVLEYRGLVKANSTWWKGFPEKSSKSGRIHPTYNTNPKDKGKGSWGTRTGRLSSSHPNIQQMPRDPETPVRKLLRPPPGYSMFEFDYSQIELRIAAAYANDEMYIEAFQKGDDPHQITADAIGITRQTSKHAAYTMLYGGSSKTLKETFERLEFQETKKIIDFPLDQAQQIISDYYAIHPNLRELAKKAEQTARQHGFVKLWTGRRRHFSAEEPWTHRKAFNSIIQGGAAEIIKDAMLRFSDFQCVENNPYRMVLQVHDSLWFEVLDEEQEIWIPYISGVMAEVQGWPVPFPVDVKQIREREELVLAPA